MPESQSARIVRRSTQQLSILQVSFSFLSIDYQRHAKPSSKASAMMNGLRASSSAVYVTLLVARHFCHGLKCRGPLYLLG